MNRPLDIREVADNVYAVLAELPAARDDDRILLANIWKKEMEGQESKDFLSLFKKGDLSQPESITRARRKFQEKYAHLRGERWESRHKMETVFREYIKSCL